MLPFSLWSVLLLQHWGLPASRDTISASAPCVPLACLWLKWSVGLWAGEGVQYRTAARYLVPYHEFQWLQIPVKRCLLPKCLLAAAAGHHAGNGRWRWDWDVSCTSNLQFCFCWFNICLILFCYLAVGLGWVDCSGYGFPVSPKSRISEVLMCPLSQSNCWSQ